MFGARVRSDVGSPSCNWRQLLLCEGELSGSEPRCGRRVPPWGGKIGREVEFFAPSPRNSLFLGEEGGAEKIPRFGQIPRN